MMMDIFGSNAIYTYVYRYSTMHFIFLSFSKVINFIKYFLYWLYPAVSEQGKYNSNSRQSKAYQRNERTKLYRVPGHIGVVGNELSNKLDKIESFQ